MLKVITVALMVAFAGSNAFGDDILDKEVKTKKEHKGAGVVVVDGSAKKVTVLEFDESFDKKSFVAELKELQAAAADEETKDEADDEIRVVVEKSQRLAVNVIEKDLDKVDALDKEGSTAACFWRRGCYYRPACYGYGCYNRCYYGGCNYYGRYAYWGGWSGYNNWNCNWGYYSPCYGGYGCYVSYGVC